MLFSIKSFTIAWYRLFNKHLNLKCCLWIHVCINSMIRVSVLINAVPDLIDVNVFFFKYKVLNRGSIHPLPSLLLTLLT